MKIRGSLAAVIVAALATAASFSTVACSAPSDDTLDNGFNTSDEISTDEAKQLSAKLAFLADATNIEIVTGPESTKQIAALKAAMPTDANLAGWLHGATNEKATVLKATFADKDPAYLTTRRWESGSGDGKVLAVVTRVTPPTGSAPFTYAERTFKTTGLRIEVGVFEDQKTKTILGTTASADQISTATTSFRNGIGQVSQALSDGVRQGICSACTKTLFLARIAGPAFLALAGTGGASATCTRLGIGAAAVTIETGPGALVAGAGEFVACEVAFWALGTLFSTAILIDGDDARINKCNEAAHGLFLNDVCFTVPPEDCSTNKIEAATAPGDKCVLMGQCARALNCKADPVTLCAALDNYSGRNADLCGKIVKRTCDATLPLRDATSMRGPCSEYASSAPAPAAPAPPATPTTPPTHP